MERDAFGNIIPDRDLYANGLPRRARTLGHVWYSYDGRGNIYRPGRGWRSHKLTNASAKRLLRCK